MLLGTLFAFGVGVAPASATLEEAMQAYERGDYVKAQSELLVAARSGDSQAQELLGFMYAMGPELYPGTTRNLHAAAQWFDRAARSGRPAARYMHCALWRHESARPPVRDIYCFDRILQTGEPPRRSIAPAPLR